MECGDGLPGVAPEERRRESPLFCSAERALGFCKAKLNGYHFPDHVMVPPHLNR